MPFLLSFIFMICMGFASAWSAETTLPYRNRIHGYSGWSTTIRGDIRTIGMSGAVTGLADSFIASGENPAGLAMTLDKVAAQITGNRIYDSDIQDYTKPINTYNL